MPDRSHRPDFGDELALLGLKVAAVREKRGLSQTALANRAGIQRKSLQNVEHAKSSMRSADGTHGKGNPKLDTVYAIAYALHVDVGYLVDPTRPVEPIPE